MLLLETPHLRAWTRVKNAVLLFSETSDSGSQTSLEDAVRAVEETNTAIYSFGFSTTQAAVKHEASKLPAPRLMWSRS